MRAPMLRYALPLPLMCAVLAGCGGGTPNPLNGPAITAVATTTTDDATPTVPVTAVTTGTSTIRVTGELTGITFDSTNDTITVANLPFDGPDGIYTNRGLAVVSGFSVYESADATADTNQRKYFAVFRQGTHSSVSSVGTGDYRDFGWGGAQYTRDGATVPDVAQQGEAVYTGPYGGVRVETRGNGQGDVSLTTGTATIDVDFLDFDTTGAVEGTITARSYYDVNGNLLGTLPTIFLATAQIDENGFIDQGTASTVFGSASPRAGEVFESGTWEGAFAGPNSEEIAGVIVITGPASQADDEEEQAQEIGVFIAVD